MKNIIIQFKYIQYFTSIDNCTSRLYEHGNPIIKYIFLSALISLKISFVGSNIYVYQFSNKSEINSLGVIPNEHY